jgi:predicted nuclease of predicted toxin-antitoxin system
VSQALKYVDLSDEEVEQLILQRLREIRKLLEEIRDILRKAGGYE